MNHSYSASYSNVELRPLKKEDIEYLRCWRNDPNNARFLRKIPFITPEMQERWFEAYLLDDDEMTFAIVETQQLNRVVGSLSLYNFQNDSVEFGKILIGDEEAHGRSIGFNSIVAVKEIIFGQLNKTFVELHVFKDNVPALKIYTRAGFRIVSERIAENELVEYKMVGKK